MDIRSQSALLACIVSLALTVAVLLRPQRPRALLLFSGVCASLFAFYLGDFLHALTQADFWLRVAIATGSFVPWVALAFFMEFLGVSARSASRGRRVSALGVVMGLSVAFSPLALQPWARHVTALWVFTALTVTFSLMLRKARQTESRVERLRLLYLAIGAGAAVLFSATDGLRGFGVPFPPLGAVITTLYMFFLAQTLQRLRLLDLHELLGKVAALSVLALILASIYGALVSWVGDRPGLFFFNTTWSIDVCKTALAVFPHTFRVINFVAGSDAPIHIEPGPWKALLEEYRIDGRPVLDLTTEQGRQAEARLLGFLDPGMGQAGVEGDESLRKNCAAGEVVTDDNMLPEWRHILHYEKP